MKQASGAGFIAASSAVPLLLGFLHLLYTFRGPKLHPRDPDITAKMMTVSLVISRETTMWRAWVGFNATHSLGLILFGSLYGYLAMRHSAQGMTSTFFPSMVSETDLPAFSAMVSGMVSRTPSMDRSIKSSSFMRQYPSLRAV